MIEQRTDFIYLGSHISPFEHQKGIDWNLKMYNKRNAEKKSGEKDEARHSN
jgi:hypothetical protein